MLYYCEHREGEEECNVPDVMVSVLNVSSLLFVSMSGSMSESMKASMSGSMSGSMRGSMTGSISGSTGD